MPGSSIHTMMAKVSTDQVLLDPENHPFAYVKSQSDDSVVYTVNYETRECDCNDYKYRRKDAGENCKHITWVLRLMSMKGMTIPQDPRTRIV